MNIIDTTGMTKAQRFALRHFRAGASETPTIAGCGYKGPTRLSLCLEKQAPFDPQKIESEAERFWWGDALEDDVFARYTLDHGVGFKAHQLLVVHPKHDFMCCTLDGLTDDDEIVDAKASSRWGGVGIVDDDPSTLPTAWKLQAQHQMACCEKDHAIWAQFVGSELRQRYFRIERDDEMIEMIIQLDYEFMEHVKIGTHPGEFEPDDADFLRKHFDRVDGEELQIDDLKVRRAAEEYLLAKEAAKYAEEAEKRWKAELLMAMENAQSAKVGGEYILSRKERGRKAMTVKASNWIEFSCKKVG